MTTDDGRPGADATCHGKRSFSSHHWATVGLRAIEREHAHDARRGHLHVYKCSECLGWHIGRGFGTRRDKRRQRDAMPPRAGRSAGVFAEADKIAKARFPNGANASQLGQIIREVLASVGRNPKGQDAQRLGAEHEHAVPAKQGDAQPSPPSSPENPT